MFLLDRSIYGKSIFCVFLFLGNLSRWEVVVAIEGILGVDDVGRELFVRGIGNFGGRVYGCIICYDCVRNCKIR